MRFLPFFFASATCLVMLSNWAVAQPSDQPTAADSSQVVSAVERFQTALATRDSSAAAALLLPDAVVLEGGGLETKEEYFGHHFEADAAFLKNMRRDVERRQVRIEEETAWVSTMSRLSGTYHGESLDLASAELMVLRQTPEGWRIAAIHWSSRERK